VDDYWRRVTRALSWQRIGVVLAITLVASAQILAQPMDMVFWSFADVAGAWLGYTAELALVAAVITVAFTLADEALPPTGGVRWVVIGAVILAASAVGTCAAWRLENLGPMPPLESVLRGSLPWSLIGIFTAGVLALHRRALRTREELQAVVDARASLLREEAEQQLQLLEAQIEPHFLFNTLASVRRLYRTHPASGAQAIESLKRYLGAALPRIRSRESTVAGEIQLVRAYLELIQVRLGRRLRYRVSVDPETLLNVPFPPLMLMTLVENAIKHGIAPSAHGGTVEVSVQARGDAIEASVADDGVGLDAAAGSGTGVGLANVRRQLAARFGTAASLTVEARLPRGVSARLRFPAPEAGAPEATSPAGWVQA
jgi:signal transduction histidine kinase